MKTTNSLADFTSKYQLTKTLRFELKPIGQTLANIQESGLISQDKERAESYKKMKKTIDAFHKHFIELAMNTVQLTELESFADLYNVPNERKKEEDYKKQLERVQTALRKEITKGFKADGVKEIFSKIDKKELFTVLLEDWIKTNKEEDYYFDEKFKTFTTYFTGFHENRKNMYSDKEQSTAIAYRLIHENLPKFLDNIKIFEKVKETPQLYEKCKTLYQEIVEYLGIKAIDEAFELNYYNEVLTQKGIDIYNLILGGRTAKEGERKIQGLNEYINLYNQRQEKQNRIPRLKPLYKQILSDRESTSFLPDKFENSQEVLDAIEDYYKANLLDFIEEGKEESENILLSIKSLLKDIPNYNPQKIYIRNDTAITDISKALFGDWSIIKDALKFAFTQTLKTGKKGLTNTQQKQIDKYLKQPYFSIAEIEDALQSYKQEVEELNSLKNTSISHYFHTHFKAKKKKDSDKEFDLIANIEAKYSCIKGILGLEYPEEKKLYQEKKTIDDLKAFLDSLMELLHFVKPLALAADSTLEKDENFYSFFEVYYKQLQLLIPLYNKVRNYATQKPYSIEKFKLNFENSTLLDGWDVNKEEANTSVLFLKDGNYYLGIMNKEHNKIFRDIPKAKSANTYSKVNYKLLPGPSKMLPKVIFSQKNIGFFNPSEEILKIRNHGTHTKGGSPQQGFEKLDFNLHDCRKIIDFFKDSIKKHSDWSMFNFSFSETNSYNSIDEFYREVSNQGYSITYTEIDDDYIDLQIKEGKLYLFQIYNKDFSTFSKGRPNMHTLYWRALFDPVNLENVVYKLNGQAEIFYREKSIDSENIIVHKAKEAIKNKNPDNKKEASTFDYDIIKDKRFTIDKFQFHIPITLNFKSKGSDYINQDVLEYLQNNPDVNIIGLDRGERHLIYLSLINQKGEILQQYSLNDIINTYKDGAGKKVKIETNYHQLLDKKEKERDASRKSWGTIENIKELKEGYISQIVHRIASMMVEYNAIVVMEDLNFGFKRGRFKVEKQVYQKLEKMLIDKLNYLVFKDKQPNEVGGLYKALQLTNKFESFQKLGKQSGFLFYVPAWNTSKIDPTTGFVNLFYAKYNSVSKAQDFFNKFDSIRYNAKENYFEFAFDYDNFTERAKGTQTKWTVCTYGERILTFRNSTKNNEWDNKELHLTEEFESLFEKNNIIYGDGSCIKTQIVQEEKKEFFEPLLNLFRLTLQMRNSITNSEIDYLISPVINQKGEFYDSRKANPSLPIDADANGAYHIAKKGLWWLEQINNFKEEDLKKLKFDGTNKGWLSFVQKGV